MPDMAHFTSNNLKDSTKYLTFPGFGVIIKEKTHRAKGKAQRGKEMSGKDNLSNRTAKSKAIQDFIAIQKRDGNGKVHVVIVPGSEAKRYQVILRRYPKSRAITSECRLEVGSHGHIECKGNSNGYVCYHSIAAVQKAAADQGFDVSFCYTQADAQRLANLHGKSPVRLISRQGKGQLWFVVHK